jgi:uncharacterized protein YkwD
MPMALLLAAVVVIGLFAVAAIVAPSLAPAFSPRGTDAADVAAPGASGPSTGAEASSKASPSAPPSPKASPSRKPSPKPAAPSSKVLAAEDEVLRMVNVERDKAGCNALRMDSRLRKAARDYSALMAAKKWFNHTSPDGSSFVDRIQRAGYPRDYAGGENIAYGYRDAAAVMKGWMNSSGHRRNILDCSFKAIGVGLAYRGSTPYWTQDFGRK